MKPIVNHRVIVLSMQQNLKEMELFRSEPDGIWGIESILAWKGFLCSQRSAGFRVNHYDCPLPYALLPSYFQWAVNDKNESYIAMTGYEDRPELPDAVDDGSSPMDDGSSSPQGSPADGSEGTTGNDPVSGDLDPLKVNEPGEGENGSGPEVPVPEVAAAAAAATEDSEDPVDGEEEEEMTATEYYNEFFTSDSSTPTYQLVAQFVALYGDEAKAILLANEALEGSQPETPTSELESNQTSNAGSDEVVQDKAEELVVDSENEGADTPTEPVTTSPNVSIMEVDRSGGAQ